MTGEEGDLFWLLELPVHVFDHAPRIKLEVIIVHVVNAYPDIVIKMYSNNGRIVDADDEYLSTSEWRCTNRLFRKERIQ